MAEAEAPRYDALRVEYLPRFELLRSERTVVALTAAQTVVEQTISGLLTVPGAVRRAQLTRLPEGRVTDVRPGDQHRRIPTIQCSYPCHNRSRPASREFFALDTAALTQARLTPRAELAERCGRSLLSIFANSGIRDLQPGEYGMFRGGLRLINFDGFKDEIVRNRTARAMPRDARGFVDLAAAFSQEVLWKVAGKSDVLPGIVAQASEYTLLVGWHLRRGDILEPR